MARWKKASIASVLAMAACLGAVYWSTGWITSSRVEELRSGANLAALEAAARIGGRIEQHRIALRQMAKFLESGHQVAEEEFASFAAGTIDLNPPGLRIVIINPDMRIGRVYPREPNRLLLGFDVRTHTPTYETVLRAIESNRPALSAPMELLGGSEGFLIAAPITSDGELLGLAVGALRLDDFLEASLSSHSLDRYDQMVLVSGTPIFASPSFEEAHPSTPTVVEALPLVGSSWEVRVRPRREIVLASLRSGQAVLWTLGGLLTLAIGGVATAATLWATGFTSRLESQRAALRETRARLDGAMQQLVQAEKLSALGELVAGVAHEINNPLAGIMGYSQLMLARELPPDLRRRLERICAEAQRMGRTVKNLLTFARKHPPEKTFLGLNGIIEKTLELKAYQFRVSQIRVSRNLAPDLPMTLIDFHQIQQVLVNLFTNAEQALVERGGRGSIHIVSRQVDGHIEALISDDGPGIPPEIQARVFEPFFTTKKEGKGTGLGLSLCFGIIQEHGGTIRLESEPGKGTTFIIKLPIVKQAEAATDMGSEAAATKTVSPLRLLVVDDESTILDMLVDGLSDKGHRVDTAYDMPEAVRKIATGSHDLIISDYRMPNGSGRDVYDAAFKRSPDLARRLVFITGDGANAETLRFIQENKVQLVLKPFGVEQIEAAMARAMCN